MLNISKVARIKQAQKELSKKLTLERKLSKKLIPVFRSYTKQFHAALKEGGRLANSHILQQNMKDILSDHYDDVTKEFHQHIVDQIGKPDNHDEILSSINTSTSIHNELRSGDSSSIIAQTTASDADKVIEAVRQNALVAGETITNATLAARARILLMQKTSGRIGTIAATETQNPAENTKQTEIDHLDHSEAEIDGQSISESKKQKEWVAILDNVTRPDHAETDGQTVDFDEPYTVGGDLLMYPGDMDLGASLENVINCRCSSIIMIA